MCSFQGLCLYSDLKNLVYQTACFLSYHIPTLYLLVVPPPPPSCYQAGGHNLSHLSSYESTNIFQIFKKIYSFWGTRLLPLCIYPFHSSQMYRYSEYFKQIATVKLIQIFSESSSSRILWHP